LRPADPAPVRRRGDGQAVVRALQDVEALLAAVRRIAVNAHGGSR